MDWGNDEYEASEGTHTSLEAFLLMSSLVLVAMGGMIR